MLPMTQGVSGVAFSAPGGRIALPDAPYQTVPSGMRRAATTPGTWASFFQVSRISSRRAASSGVTVVPFPTCAGPELGWVIATASDDGAGVTTAGAAPREGMGSSEVMPAGEARAVITPVGAGGWVAA